MVLCEESLHFPVEHGGVGPGSWIQPYFTQQRMGIRIQNGISKTKGLTYIFRQTHWWFRQQCQVVLEDEIVLRPKNTLSLLVNFFGHAV